MANLPDKDKLVRNFSRCLNWEEKYLYVIELGAKLPPLDEAERQAGNLISGCQSQVWIVMRLDEQGQVEFTATATRRSSKACWRWCLFCIAN